jgi:hypothetical protein
MQHTRAPGSVGSHGGHLPEPMYSRKCIADGAAMREHTLKLQHMCKKDFAHLVTIENVNQSFARAEN